MTIEEMREAVVAQCEKVNTCDQCIFEDYHLCAKYGSPEKMPDEVIPQCYRDFFNEIPEVDVVNHPSHYETGKFECIEVMIETQGKEAVMNFCLCNAFKYLYRHTRKNGVEDVKKAKWYLDKYLELCGGDR